MPKIKIKTRKWTLAGYISGEVEMEAPTVKELLEMKKKGLSTFTVS